EPEEGHGGAAAAVVGPSPLSVSPESSSVPNATAPESDHRHQAGGDNSTGNGQRTSIKIRRTSGVRRRASAAPAGTADLAAFRLGSARLTGDGAYGRVGPNRAAAARSA